MRRLLLAAAILFCVSSIAHAQIVSIYGTYSPLRATGVATGDVYSPSAGYQEQYTSFWANGFGGGVTVNFLPLPVVSLGFDVRGSSKPGTVGADTAMAGLKLGVHPPAIRIKPYIEGGVGYLATRTVNVSSNAATYILTGGSSVPVGGTFNNQSGFWEILGGIDYPLARFIDYRLIEIGGGKVILDSTNNPSLLTINTGIVLHF